MVVARESILTCRQLGELWARAGSILPLQLESATEMCVTMTAHLGGIELVARELLLPERRLKERV